MEQNNKKQSAIEGLLQESIYLPLSMSLGKSEKIANETIGQIVASKINSNIYQPFHPATHDGNMLASTLAFVRQKRLYITPASTRASEILKDAGFQLGVIWRDGADNVWLPKGVTDALKCTYAARKRNADFCAEKVHNAVREMNIYDLPSATSIHLMQLTDDIYSADGQLLYKAIDVHSNEELESIIERAGTYDYNEDLDIIFLIDSFGRAYMGKISKVLDAVQAAGYVRTIYEIPFAKPGPAPQDEQLKESLNKYFCKISFTS